MHIKKWQERMPEPQWEKRCSMNCSPRTNDCDDCGSVRVSGDPIHARDAEIAELRAALEAVPVPAAIYPEVPEGWKRTEDGCLIPPAGLVGIAYVAPAAPDTDPNAAWLTLAHIICADAGIPAGHISDRLGKLRDLLAASVQVQEPVRLDTEQSREYLIEFMMKHFTDKTYHRYIRADGGRNSLAGDFAWQMARALRMVTPPAQPVAVPDGWKLMPLKATGVMADAGAFSGLPVGAAEPWIAKKVWEAMAAQSPAAPAGQGDAKDAERWRFIMAAAGNENGPEAAVMEKLSSELPDNSADTTDEFVKLLDAAIAASKAGA